MRLALGVVLLLLGACGSEPAVQTITGVVIDIDARNITDVESFTIKAGDKTYVIHIDPAKEYDFPVSHLSSHRAGAEPVRVEVEERDGQLVASTISDA